MALSKPVFQRLSLHYFFYFGVLGALLPYIGLYFQSLGLTAIEIGQLLAVLLSTKIIAPNLWGWLADQSGLPMRWVRLATGLALLFAVGLLLFDSFWGLFFTILFFSFFWHASLPQFESYTFGCLGDEKHRYGEIRLWGSIGFIVAVLFIGWQIEHFSIIWLPIDLFILLAVVWLTTFLLKDQKRTHSTQISAGFVQILKQPAVWSLLFVSFLMQLSHGVYYAFFTIHLNALGYDSSTIAWLWALGVMAEVAVFYWMSTLFKRHTVRFLILLSLLLTIVRWLMNAYLADSLMWMLFAQLLHAASFGLFHAAAIHLIDAHFKGKHHGKGQAVFAASSHGLGGALGMLIAGYTWTIGGAELSYGLSALAVAISFVVAYRWIR